MGTLTDFLLELRSEEIPARMQAAARAELQRLFLKEMDAAGVTVGDLTIWSTPRRLVLIARDLPLATAAVSKEVKGPRTSAPAQALEGFLRKTGLVKQQLTDRDGIWFAVIDNPGRATGAVLAEAIPAIVRAFNWPKSMRWGGASASSESLRWVRPLSGIVALFGDDIVPCSVEGIASGAATTGHRFHHHGDIIIGNAADYAMKLRAAHVIVDHDERAAIIRGGAAKAATNAGLALVADEALVIENAALTEWPVPLLGRFDAAFLEVPPEVIQLTARVNQKYFVCEDAHGKLANAFICTANIAPVDAGAGVIDGNRKVLAARLSDARFFWEQDQKKTLAQHAEKLANIVFHEKLGTVADKVERVAKSARWLCEEGIVAGDPDLAEQAARLCKADLVTEMVGEFPELQGLMGGYYAAHEGLDPQVAAAIRDHYKPVGQGDEVPTAPVTVAVSLADKLDTLLGFFANKFYPTGSRDPYALRRAALAILKLIQVNSIRIDLDEYFVEDIGSFFKTILDPSRKNPIEMNISELSRDPNFRIERLNGRTSFFRGDIKLMSVTGYYDSIEEWDERIKTVWDGFESLCDFVTERIKVSLVEAGCAHDHVAAAMGALNPFQPPGLTNYEFDLVRLLARVDALQAFVGTPDGANLLAGYKRAANLLKQAGMDTPSPQQGEGRGEGERGAAERPPSPLEHPYPAASLNVEGSSAHDTALLSALDIAEPAAANAVAEERFTDAMTALASLRAPIDAFFAGVMVNDPDAAVRAFRLSLLARFRDAVHTVADFSKIAG